MPSECCSSSIRPEFLSDSPSSSRPSDSSNTSDFYKPSTFFDSSKFSNPLISFDSHHPSHLPRANECCNSFYPFASSDSSQFSDACNAVYSSKSSGSSTSSDPSDFSNLSGSASIPRRLELLEHPIVATLRPLPTLWPPRPPSTPPTPLPLHL